MQIEMNWRGKARKTEDIHSTKQIHSKKTKLTTTQKSKQNKTTCAHVIPFNDSHLFGSRAPRGEHLLAFLCHWILIFEHV